MWYRTCPNCLEEIDDFLEIYQSQSPSGNTYGEDVAFIMLAHATIETKPTIRDFINNPQNWIGHEADYPWMIAYCPELQKAFKTTEYPTAAYADCEGLIMKVAKGKQTKEAFLSNFDTNINGWLKRDERDKAEQNAAAIDAVVPVQAVSKEDDLPQKPEMEVLVPAQRVVSFDDRKRVS